MTENPLDIEYFQITVFQHLEGLGSRNIGTIENPPDIEYFSLPKIERVFFIIYFKSVGCNMQFHQILGDCNQLHLILVAH